MFVARRVRLAESECRTPTRFSPAPGRDSILSPMIELTADHRVSAPGDKCAKEFGAARHDQMPDGGIVIELYKGVRTVRDVEAVNEYVKAQVIKAQSIAADIARLHAATYKSCEGLEAPQIETITNKARGFSTTLARVDGELKKSLTATRQSVEMERPGSTRAKEDLNRFVLAAHELGRLRVQAQEIAKSIEGLAASIRTRAASCTPTPVPPLFAERDAPTVGVAASRSPAFSPKRVSKPTTTPTPRFAW